MAKFTSTTNLDISWYGNDLIGTPSTTYRIPDALYDEFNAAYAGLIPGLTWVTTDEIGGISVPAHSAITGVTADQHHAQAHSISGADHTGTLAHSALGSVTADQHHVQVHSISGADHTGTLAHTALGSVTADQHHAQSHDHSAAGDGSTLRPGTILIPTASVKFTAATAMPGSPTADDLCYRTDLNILFFWDGTRWVSVNLYQLTMPQVAFSYGATATDAHRDGVPIPVATGQTVYLVDHVVEFIVVGGTALGASHKWVGTFNKVDSTNTDTLLDTININSGASDAWRRTRQSINAIVDPASFFELRTTWTKTGTPGSLFPRQKYSYRLVST